MGSLYESIDPDTRRPVALKVIRRDAPAQRDAIGSMFARLRIEAEVGRRLSHPNIVSVHEFGEDEGFAYLATEYVAGQNLKTLLDQSIDYDSTRALDLMQPLLDALQHAHDAGVWHRDVKPANILLGYGGQVKLCDFGIAALRGSALPQPEAIMGTPGFIAPESYLTDDSDGRVDVYAAGAVLYHLLTGVPPFVGSASQIMFGACYETPLPPSQMACDAELQPADAVVLKALATRPEDRFATPAEFLESLRPLADLRRHPRAQRRAAASSAKYTPDASR